MYLLIYIYLVLENDLFQSYVPKNSIGVIKIRTEFKDSQENAMKSW